MNFVIVMIITVIIIINNHFAEGEVNIVAGLFINNINWHSLRLIMIVLV